MEEPPIPRPSEVSKAVHVTIPLKDYDRLIREARRSDIRVASLCAAAVIFYLDHKAQERRDHRAAQRAARAAETSTP